MENFFVAIPQSGVWIRKNGIFDDPGKVICVDTHWSFSEFLRIASERLDLHPRAVKAFNIDGTEINDCMMIGDTDSLFLSLGEPFISPLSLTNDDELYEHGESSKTTNDHSSIPSHVGMYNVGVVLGCGAFGEVRLGTNKLTAEKVALKFLKKSEILSMGAAERTSTEIQCLTSLDHCNIIRLFTRLELHKYVVLVFDLMEGGDMFQYQRRRGPLAADAALSVDDARKVFSQVTAGVEYAHKHHIIHRDLKLENLLLKDNSLRLVKIGDFGLSKFCRPGMLLKVDGSGTLSTAAPELLSTQGNYSGPPVDIWSMGVILFALLCGRLPFEGANLEGDQPSEAKIRKNILKGRYIVDERVSYEAKDLIRRILRTDPAERATVAQIMTHPWVTRGSRVISRDGDPASVEAILSLESVAELSTINSSTDNLLSETDGFECIPGRSGRERAYKKLSSIHEVSSHTASLPMVSSTSGGLLYKSSASSSSKSPIDSPSLGARNASLSPSPMRISCSALDELTDELDKSIFDSTPPPSSPLPHSDSPTPSHYSRVDRMDRVDSTSPINSGYFHADLGPSSGPGTYSATGIKGDPLAGILTGSTTGSGPSGENSPHEESIANAKGWGATRSRNNSNSISNSSSLKTTYSARENPTRDNSLEGLQQLGDRADETERSTIRVRIMNDDRLKSASRFSSSFSSRQSSGGTTTNVPVLLSNCFHSSQIHNSTSQGCLSDELDKRLVGLDKRLHDLEKFKEHDRRFAGAESPSSFQRKRI